MLRNDAKQTTFYSGLYEKIPEKHLLKRIDKAMDFGFINELVEESYCRDFGRPAKEPEMMMKLLFLEYIYDLSDVKVIEEGSYNLAFLWFLGLNPEDKLPDASLLAKFRTQRLKDITLDEVITEMVRQCVENGIIKSDSISIDTTHVEANTTKKVPERIMKHLAKRIFQGLKEDLGTVPESINTSVPDYEQIKEPKQAKAVMKEYLEEVITQAEASGKESTQRAIAEARDILADEKFLLQKGLRSLCDKDARVGYKSREHSFFGYKAESVMTAEERIITAIDVHSGEYVDGKEFSRLAERTVAGGMKVGEVYGDKAYFRADILDKIKDMQAKGYIPVNACAYQINEELFSYNKDTDQWFCFMGNHTVSKKRVTRQAHGKTEDIYSFLFKKEQCEHCSHRDICIGKSQKKARKLQVGLHTAEFYAVSQEQKQPEFLEKYKKRAAHEWKNGEMKRFHGLSRARGFGLRSMSFQAKLTAIAVNLKRIAAIYGENISLFTHISELKGYLFTRLIFRRKIAA